MKLTCVLLTVFFLHLHVIAFSQTISWSGKNVSLERVFSVVKKQTGYFFFYNYNLIKDAHRINLNVKNATLTEVLELCFKNQPIDYVIENKTIVITKRTVPVEAVKSKEVKKKDSVHTVLGKINDEKGEPLIGATVIVAGTQIATAASSTGNFMLRLPDGKNELIISSVGFEDTVISVSKLSAITITMKRMEYVEASDVMVIGYGTSKKNDLTGSVSSVNIRDLGDRQNPGLDILLQGKIAGVDVNAGSIRIRGVTSFNNTDPLVVIDGFLGGNMQIVNPNDIESIEVLKDASSTAIYGSRGANGVILVTTKRPTAGPNKLAMYLNSGFANTPKKLDVLNASQFIDYVQEGLRNAGQSVPPKLLTDSVRRDVTDWQNEVFKTAHSNSIDINFSGGTQSATYYVSMGYKHADEIYIGPRHDVITGRLKNIFTIRKWVRFGDNVAFAYRVNKGAGPSQVISMINMQPYIPVRDTNNYWGYGTINRQADLGDAINPVMSGALTHPVEYNLDYQANIWAEIEPFKGLKYHIQTGVAGSYNRSTLFTEKYENGAQQTIDNSFSDNSSYSLNPVFESYLTYRNQIKKHDFTLMAGNTWQNFAHAGGISIYGQNYANTNVLTVFNAATRSITNEYFARYAFMSYFGRINYQYNNRYLFTFNLRRDGSPRFSPQHRWGTFPSVAMAWKLHEEIFIRKLNIFDELKLRASWGKSGNDAIGNFRYLSQIWSNGVYYVFGTTPRAVAGATVIDDASQNIKWESTTSKAIGVDMAFLRHSLDFTIEYFNKNSNDILFPVPRPESLGYGLGVTGGNAIVNAASCVNKGFELQAGYKNRIGVIKYSIEANYTYVKNKVTSLGLGQPFFLDNVSRTTINKPIGYFYGYTADGIFKTKAELDAANEMARTAAAKSNSQLTSSELAQVFYQLPATSPGDVRYRDLNGDGMITDDKDRSIIGSSIPTNLFGLSVSLNYNRIDLNIFMNAITGSRVYFSGYEQTRSMKAVQNQESYVLNRWKSENDPGNGIVPRAIMGDPAQNARPSTLMVSSGNYLKLRQVSFGYTLADKVITRFGFNRLRMYVSGSNLLTFTKFPGYDPEFGGSNLNRGVTFLNYPMARSISFGLQAGL
ncbi:MAG: SusC/RagA family TonB-linked outer membrane protein [Chitinophagaceae bacterium]